MPEKLKVLLIEDNLQKLTEYKRQIDALRQVKGIDFDLKVISTIEDAEWAAGIEYPEIVITDLVLGNLSTDESVKRINDVIREFIKQGTSVIVNSAGTWSGSAVSPDLRDRVILISKRDSFVPILNIMLHSPDFLHLDPRYAEILSKEKPFTRYSDLIAWHGLPRTISFSETSHIPERGEIVSAPLYHVMTPTQKSRLSSDSLRSKLQYELQDVVQLIRTSHVNGEPSKRELNAFKRKLYAQFGSDPGKTMQVLEYELAVIKKALQFREDQIYAMFKDISTHISAEDFDAFKRRVVDLRSIGRNIRSKYLIYKEFLKHYKPNK